MKQLSGLDAAFLYMETPTTFGHVNGLGIYQRPDADFDPYDAVYAKFASVIGAIEPAVAVGVDDDVRGVAILVPAVTRGALDPVVVRGSAEARVYVEVELRLAVINPRLAWPNANEGVALTWPQARLAPGELVRVPVVDADLAEIAAAPNFEGVLSAFDASDGKLIDRVTFSDWPNGASLARDMSPSGRFRFCNVASPGEPNTACDPLPSRAW